MVIPNRGFVTQRAGSSNRTAQQLSESLHKRLNAYALAASAAGVGVLALAQPADAKVVYTPTHKWLPLNPYYYLDLNHDGVNDFKLHLLSTKFSGGFARSLTVRWVASSQSQNDIYSFLSQDRLCAAALPKGKEVGPESPGFRLQLKAAWLFQIASSTFCNDHTDVGPWLQVKKQAYLGLRFAIKGQVHFGWARLGHIRYYAPPRALLTGYAYETVPNKAIITGKTKGPDVVTVQGATLGHLAAGASAISAWRTDGTH
jgi:hypothetical protein